MEKTFTRAGTSVLNGVKAYRFANDLNRERVLAANGHTDIIMFELGSAMTKAEAVLFLNSREIVAEDVKVATKTAKPRKAVKVVAEDDDFVEPRDERIQVAMTRLARLNPMLTARQLLDQVMLTFKHFGDYEPNF